MWWEHWCWHKKGSWGSDDHGWVSFEFYLFWFQIRFCLSIPVLIESLFWFQNGKKSNVYTTKKSLLDWPQKPLLLCATPKVSSAKLSLYCQREWCVTASCPWLYWRWRAQWWLEKTFGPGNRKSLNTGQQHLGTWHFGFCSNLGLDFGSQP